MGTGMKRVTCTVTIVREFPDNTPEEFIDKATESFTQDVEELTGLGWKLSTIEILEESIDGLD
jgi:hypothetical protein